MHLDQMQATPLEASHCSEATEVGAALSNVGEFGNGAGEGTARTESEIEAEGRRARFPRPACGFILALKLVALCCGLVALFGAFSFLDSLTKFVSGLVIEVEQLGSLAPLAYIALYVVLVFVFVPAELLAATSYGICLQHISAGFVFTKIYGRFLGITTAFFCSLLAASVAGFCCFYLTRVLLQRPLHAALRGAPLFRALDAAVEEGGLPFVCLLRLSPVLPYSAMSYLLGVTALKARHFVLGTFAAAPLIFVFVFIGSALEDIQDLDLKHFSWAWQRILLLIVGLAMAFASLVYITVLTRRKLAAAYEATARERDQEQQLLATASETAPVAVGGRQTALRV